MKTIAIALGSACVFLVMIVIGNQASPECEVSMLNGTYGECK